MSEFSPNTPISFSYMPIVRLKDFSIYGYEVLVRFDGTPPSDTQKRILEIESRGEAPILDARVFSLLEAGLRHRDFLHGLKVSVNVSGQSVSDPSFVRNVRRLLKCCEDPSRLIFEITETAPITNMPNARVFSSAVHSKLSAISMDDYGSGYSNAERFRSLPFDGLKIDGSFVQTWHEDEASRMYVANAVMLARTNGATTTAEFISGPQDVEMARFLGVEFGQGYYFGKPEPWPVDPDTLSKELVDKFPGSVFYPGR